MKPQLPTRQAIIDRRTYEPPGEGRADKLRLDFNENTAGCSPAVRRALAKLTPKLLSMYPEYDRGTGVSRDIFKWRPKNSFSRMAAMTRFDSSSTPSSMPGPVWLSVSRPSRCTAIGAKSRERRSKCSGTGPRWSSLSRECCRRSLRARASCSSAIPTIPPARSSTNPSSKQF